MRVPLAECRIIGATQPLKGRAVFVRAPLVVGKVGEPLLLKVQRYLDGTVEGEELTPEDWDGLLRTHEALKLPEPVSAREHAALWLLRQEFKLRHEALHQLQIEPGALIKEWHQDGIALCLVDEEDAASLRRQWTEFSFKRARQEGDRGRYDEALRSAREAFHLSPIMQPEHIALLAALFSQLDQSERSLGYLQMAENSRGSAFRRQAEEKRDHFKERFVRLRQANETLKRLLPRKLESERLLEMSPTPGRQRAA